VNADNRSLRTEFSREHAGHHVQLVMACDGNKKVGLTCTRSLEHGVRGTMSFECLDIDGARDALKGFRVVINNRDVVRFFGQVLSQVGPGLTRSDHNDFQTVLPN
jgi:hypothetical protein